MNSEFHYYTVAFLAVKAGLNSQTAEEIAYSSQFVDNNLTPWKITGLGEPLFTQATQNYNVIDPSVLNEILIPFHFLPVGPGEQLSVRKDGKTNPWDVRPNSPLAKALLVDAFRENDPLGIGIALHAYADTWAHQNFIAPIDDWNRLYLPQVGSALADSNIVNSNFVNSFIPPGGHAQALKAPDEWLSVWEDPRLLSPKVNNVDRFIEASRKVFRYLCVWTGKDFQAEESAVLDELNQMIQLRRGRPSEERLREFILGGITPYNKSAWLEEAVEPNSYLPSLEVPFWSTLDKVATKLQEHTGVGVLGPREARAKPNFTSSRFYRWQQAAQAHRKRAHQRLDQMFPHWRS